MPYSKKLSFKKRLYTCKGYFQIKSSSEVPDGHEFWEGDTTQPAANAPSRAALL